jgi:uncharacterized repeat protein (TIGR03803 family)
MKAFAFRRFALCMSGAAALLAACGGPQPPVAAPGAMSQSLAAAAYADRAHYKVVYSFSGGSDGANPFAGLIDVGGTLYGTTVAGGTYSCNDDPYYGCGTVYSVTPGGTEKVLHDFGAGSDGSEPRAGLIDVDGTLYGTTLEGGSYPCYGSSYSPCGTVFSITPSGAEQVLHSFSGYPNDGAEPDAGLIDVKGTLYGTTGYGGRGECYYSGFACGTVFSITTGGTESLLHSFTGHPDGAFPSVLIDVKGTLYGTTSSGGKHGLGTVFSITTGGAERVLHSFGAGSDGRIPYAGLIELHGKLYGTTSGGGAYSCGTAHAGCGTVFSITPGGTEKVLHSFGSGADGARPFASLIELNGTLYGTTLGGGTHSCGSNCGGDGTVFSITPDGTEKVVHSFDEVSEARAGLIAVNGTLYGTTAKGGAHGYGTVFSLKP